MRLLSFDPGKNSFAWAYIDSNGKCKHRGFVRTITTMDYRKLPDELDRFTTDIKKLMDQFELGSSLGHAVVIERMQHRPKLGAGAVVEYINVMIGMVLLLARERGIQTIAVPSATWKAHMRKVYGLDKKDLFVMATQKVSVKAPKGLMRKLKGKLVQCKTTTVEVRGVLAAQPQHGAGEDQITAHEADAIGIGCFGWYKATGMDIVRGVLTW